MDNYNGLTPDEELNTLPNSEAPEAPEAPEEPDMGVDITSTEMIQDDDQFVEYVKQAKKMIDIMTDHKEDMDSIDPEIFKNLPNTLRGKIAIIIKYVMDKMSEENAMTNNEVTNNEVINNEVPNNEVPNNEVPNNEMLNSQVSPPAAPFKSTIGGKKKKGGAAMEMNRILNVKDMGIGRHDPSQDGSRDASIAGSLHSAFSAGHTTGYSSIGNLPTSEVNTMLPYYGTGGKSKRSNRMKPKA